MSTSRNECFFLSLHNLTFIKITDAVWRKRTVAVMMMVVVMVVTVDVITIEM